MDPIHGLTGLRVIDASIMPNQTSRNTATATMVITLKGNTLCVSQGVFRTRWLRRPFFGNFLFI
ncbi:GMC oxidoreductase [Vreelandella titanicae]|uniref:GMC oxidoreductase n=1 Tax=Vreelandella titanicae TaxID=664683 RepID=UPI003CE527ED